ncbi:cell surface glycoprotein CD200 receptor 1-B-like [Scomber scombrus]|uniref:cell surface glycoprotein CD200 receptor 1-B-like n=1 Tax=Scomber scombrus TaxID=13677 RepID=UPI002DDA1E67|nr:cell surface glycoprotein CD200 receptor 1-B-like [Scomber scombrus]
MWVFAVIILSVCETWSLETVVRNSTFDLGSDVNLTCSNKPWDHIFYVIWNINLKYKDCRIAQANDGTSENSCYDGKSLQKTSRAQSYLHIPNFSNDDVGVYKCETAHTEGADDHIIYVTITVPPNTSAWLEWKGNKMVAVCKAQLEKPAANISWSYTGTSSYLETWLGSDGLITVESRMELPDNMDTKHLNCTITHHYWERVITLVPEPIEGQPGQFCRQTDTSSSKSL